MDIAITLHRNDLIRAIREFLPMRLLIGNLDENDDPAWIEIDEPESVTFVPGVGLRLGCAAQVHYPIAILPDDFTVQHATLQMVPKILTGPDGPILAFTLDLEDVNFESLPKFVDRAVVKRVNAAFVDHVESIAWNFSKTLTRMVQLPRRLERVRVLELGEPQGEVTVTADGILLQLSLDATFHHDAAETKASP